jgi:hypothetical protein
VPVSFSNLTIGATSSAPPGVCPLATGNMPQFTCNDVGTSFEPGSQTVSNGVFNVQASGGDIWNTYDQYRFLWIPQNGDGTFSARVVSVTNPGGAWQKSGVMMRSGGTDPSAPYYGVFITPSNGLVVQWRATEGGSTSQIQVSNPTVPIYLMVARYTQSSSGTVYYTAYTSGDNVTWTPVSGSTTALTLPGQLVSGLAADSYDPSNYTYTAFDSVAQLDAAPQPPGICPSAWSCADIGGALPAGQQNVSGGTWTIQAGGGDIWSTSDQFHFDYQSLTGDGTVTAHVDTINSAGAWAKEGVMLRATTDPGSPYYALFVTPSNGLAVQYRTVQGGSTSQILTPGSVPQWVRVAQWTDTSGATPVIYYSAYVSSDGSSWTLVPGSTQSFSMSGPLLAGTATDSYNQGTAATITMDSIAVAAQEFGPPAGVCLAAYTCQDIGGATPAGSQTFTGTTLTVQGGGGDIWDASDQFHYVSQQFSGNSDGTGDGTVSVHVASQTAGNAWAKSGVMMRATSDPGSPYYAILATEGNGIVVQYRTAQGGGTSQLAVSTGTAPVWLRLVRYQDSSSGTAVNYVTAYTSSDGSTWTEVPGSTVEMDALTGSLLAGLAVTSHDTSNLATTVFDTFAITTQEIHY